MRKLFYIANIRFPTERAHGVQVAHMCASFARHMRRYDADTTQMNADTDIAVTLLVPDRKTIDEDPYAYYGVERNFTVEKIAVPDIVRFGRVGFFIESLVFAWRTARRVRATTDIRCTQMLQTSDVHRCCIYAREELPLLFLPRRRAFYEAHQIHRSFFFRFLTKRAKGIVAITQGLKDALVRQGLSGERILVAHDGYDEKQFTIRISKEEARRKFGLPTDAKIAMYIGGLEPWKGAETLCKAAASLEQNGILVAIIGGTEEEIDRFQHKYPLVRFLRARPYRELAANQQAADILVVPNSGEYETSKSFTSPLKLFAHMASDVPIVASRLPSLAEVLSKKNAYLVAPDDPVALTDGINYTLQHPVESAARAEQAAMNVKMYSWDKRAEYVLAYIQCQRQKEFS